MILLTDELMKEHCKRILRRIAWRLQYTSKKRSSIETTMIEPGFGEDTMETVASQLYVQQLLSELPEKARFIIKSTVIDGMTEEEVARKLNITRQGVNKCKIKYLRLLAQKITRSV
ncbi:sigma factor-like helix-turn-helix DNA-binding protein [Brevibacillus laterosporus]|uniref:Sigma factor-like helix-turn-helix DNA-binding protein n=1 Tax=Brevibacillus laterosporus TaxID=1465 RepID=A0AAP3DM46_BRELA|nr:sigma factor-like helix-turn-helix DNA-binding protein [Brevibacillus laterosporus]MCR8982579.1 sigma-70 family RNA polymerase sigma factor [Brevibacillus laterosporus]MCZ0809735.1 sigma factor-like helix-turn-helix DNA-binding protein [Brevibacillus laterosporus]MCZ0828329.1 sigma factor-like helix-turn-helix DNA-binding protein [Brevibacillus laterosporus]MCZ0851395.1 sigma factor-like helix-turn-helix DNA-binding protein [Brevibacillus laterosporus]